MSLLKMQIIKSDENMTIFKRLRNAIEIGDFEDAHGLINVLEESNGAALEDMQYEISDGINLMKAVAQLCDQLKNERLEYNESLAALQPKSHRARQRSNSPTMT